MLIARQADMQVAGLAGSGEEAVELYSALRPDVTLMDLQLGRMSGVATATRAMVRAVEGTPTRIVDTRKTTPGLRVLEKAAV